MTVASFEDIHNLPVYGLRDNILRSVDNNQVTIITAETGAGKSTQVPQFLAEHGYQKVIVTQPRILAARNLSARVREEYAWRTSKDADRLVGYRTAHERDDDPETVILYCTDGLQLVRELTGSGINGRQVLVLDEIHEWNENMEVLIAWAKKRCLEEPLFRVVLMSATIEADALAGYFAKGGNIPEPAPIDIEGRSFPVEKRHGQDVIDEIFKQLQEGGRNMLVFLPGKAEIEAVGDAIAVKATINNVPVIPLHSQLEPEQQQLAFGKHQQGKVVLTTNIAQTSVTIDDIDTVIDSGLERRSEVRNGVEGLFIAQISQADCLQRAGRAGRTKPGLYVLAQYDILPCSPLDKRPEYGVPEILRKHIDRLVLRLANISIDIEELDLYHSPSHRTIKQAKRTLVSLGALTPAGSEMAVTAIGRQMERFPVESGYARMLVESGKYSDEIQNKLAAIIAIQEVGGIVKGGPKWTGWRRYTNETRSDLLAQYEVLLKLPTIAENMYDELGIIGKNVDKAMEVNERLVRDLGLQEVALERISQNEAEELMRCIVAGQLHQLWSVEPDGTATNITDRSQRQASSGSVVKHAGLIAGIPFDLQIPTPKGLETLNLVNDITAVNPDWLEDMAPEQFSTRPGKIFYDNHHGTLARRTILQFNGNRIETASIPVLDHTHENQRLFVELYGAWLHEQLEKERRTLQAHNYRRIPQITAKQVQQHVRHIAEGAVSLLELSRDQRVRLAKLSRLETYLDDNFVAKLNTQRGDGGQRGKYHGFQGRKHSKHLHHGKQGKRRYDRRDKGY